MIKNKGLYNLLKLIFPKLLLEYFDISDCNNDSTKIEVWLDEKDYKEHSVYKEDTIVSHGFTDERVIHDFSFRDIPVYLHVRRRLWYNETRGETFSYRYDDLIQDKKLTREFVIFLTEGKILAPGISFF